MNPHIQQLVSSFDRQGIDALLITHDIHIRYLTGFPAAESWLFVCPKKTFYITDFRYLLEARKGLKNIVVKRYTKSIFKTLFDIVHQQKIKTIGFDDQHLSLALFKRLKTSCPKTTKLVVRNGLVEGLREVKTNTEVARIRKALKLHHDANRFLKRIVKPGLTEFEVFLRLERFVQSRKAFFSFDPIVASGPNSCFPHAKVTDRKIRNNEPVLIDMGIDLEGYKSDLTRMFFLGKIPKLVRDVFAIVEVAQKRAIEKIREGVPACEIDQAARGYISQNRLGRFFGHSLGHGVGLEIHEDPRISQNNSTLLKKGMVFTVEPAVYLPNKFGIRIEDMVLVTSKGCEVLSGYIH